MIQNSLVKKQKYENPLIYQHIIYGNNNEYYYENKTLRKTTYNVEKT